LFPAKTYTIGAIEVQNKFFKDFLRGHLDGDGNIQTYIDTRGTYKERVYTNYRVFVRFISASKKHILWLHKKIKELSPVSGAVVCTKPKNKNCVPIWGIKFGKHESIQLLKWIYYKKNLPTLLRKRESAEEVIKRVRNEKRKQYTLIK
jgi:methionine salvage enolase-phosphatase E1